VAIAYAAAGTFLTHLIGRPLIKLNFNQQRYEADFRFSLVRLRENSESVAFYGGEGPEKQSFGQRFVHVFDNFWKIMRYQKRLTWFTSFYSQVAVIFPIVVAAPRYFAKEIQLGGLMQIASAFGKVQDALSFFVDAYAELAEWRAVVDRLTGFVDDMESSEIVRSNEKLIINSSNAGNALVFTNLQINLPDGRNLLQEFYLRLNQGDTMLVVGASGAGKSTLLRTLAGICPYAEGNIDLPYNYTALFVPQKPYLPLGTLREVLLYPQQSGVSDEKIKRILELCRLEKLYRKLDHIEDWSRVFSLGEQQKIAFARIFLKEPDWLFLDEATEKRMYDLLYERLPKTTIVSVGHRSTLNIFHTKKLTINGDGTWSLLR
jgi:putative ATP-binding cassette transporter